MTRSSTPSFAASSISALRWRSEECTPPSETSPIRCTRGASRSASRMTSFSASEPSSTALSMRSEVLRDDRAGAEVEVADLGVAHLPRRQSDRLAARGQLRVVVRSQSSSNTGVSASEIAFPGPSCASPQPSRMTRQTPGTVVTGAAISTICANDPGVEAGAADERAVDVGQRQQLLGVLGLQRAAVEDPHRLAGVLVDALDERTHEGDRLLRLLRRRAAARADRPDRLVGHDDLGQPLDRDLLEPLLDLVAQLALGVAALALLLGLADAQDRRQAGLERRRHLERQRAVGLAEQLAPLGVPEHDAVDVDLGQHLRRHLAGERALVGLVHGLRVDLDARAARGVDQRLQREERSADRDVDAVGARDLRQQRLDELLGLAIVLYIFQLPAMNGLRLMTAPPRRAASCPR